MTDIIFNNYSNGSMWEIAGPSMSVYITHDMVLGEDKTGLEMLLSLQGIPPTKDLIQQIVDNTKDPKGDMFIVSF